MQKALEATITPNENFNVEEACMSLNKAMKGLGTDEMRIITALCAHSNDQRQQIKSHYLTMYGGDLVKDLKSELSGLFLDTVMALMKQKYLIEAETLRKAMKGAGTNEKALIEIFCTRPSKDLKGIKDLYEKIYKSNLDKDLDSDLSGDFRRVLRALANGSRPEDTEVNDEAAKKDAQTLYDAGVGRFGTDESEFTRILCSKSYAHLIKVFEHYEKINYNKDILNSIRAETSGDLMDAYVTIAKCIVNRPAYFAEEIQKCIKGLGTDDQKLISIFATRSEIDLASSKKEYQNLFKKTMKSDIEGDTSGDYKKILLKIIEKN